MQNMISDSKIESFEYNIVNVTRELIEKEYPPQRSDEWYAIRNNKITASDGGCILGLNHFEPVSKFILKKISDSTFESNESCFWGNKYENIAKLIYEEMNECTVFDLGLIEHSTYQFIGASPDGIVGIAKDPNNVGKLIEIKCPLSRKIKKSGNIIGSQVPIYYWIQVQLQLECCNLNSCDFFQCCIKEYNDEYEYLLDECAVKGVLIHLIKQSGLENNVLPNKSDVYNFSKFVYPPKTNMSIRDNKKFIEEECSKFDDSTEYRVHKIIYWKMYDYGLVNVERDNAWFMNNLNTFDLTWKYVELLRKNEQAKNALLNHIEKNKPDNDSIMNMIKNMYKICDKIERFNNYVEYIKNLSK